MEINWKLIESEIKGLKLTNKKMAELLGIGIATWNRYRAGESDIPLKLFYKVIEILDIEYKDAIIDSPIMEYRIYFKEGRYLDIDAFEDRIQKIDNVVAKLETCETEQELKEYEELMYLFGEERMLKVAKGCIEHNKLYDEIYPK